MPAPGMLTIDQLQAKVTGGEVDTVLTVFPDLQGRFMGKRVMAQFFIDDMVPGSGGEEGFLACNYLLAVDSQMNVLPGYRFTNWETGYGDFKAVPDMATLRMIPWIERTALVICDLVDEHTSEPIEVSPRQILKRQIARAAEQGYVCKAGTEVEFFLYRDTYEEAAKKGYRDLIPHSDHILDYHILQTTKDEYIIRDIRLGMYNAGIPIEFSKGEAGYGQHEINVRYAEALNTADMQTIFKNGCKEIAHFHNRAITFMAKPSISDVGSSCHIHSSLWDSTTDRSLMFDADGRDHMSETFRYYLGGLMAAGQELAWMFAHYVNSYKRYQPDSWAPTGIVWGNDNRTCGYRVVGHGQGMRVESRIPGADTNPYLALAATIAAGLYGIENKIDCGEPFKTNAYTDPAIERVPWNLADSIRAFEQSKIGPAAWGDEVQYHLVNTARQEWVQFNKSVTDHELRRNFEMI